jgi:hypothetical protein
VIRRRVFWLALVCALGAGSQALAQSPPSTEGAESDDSEGDDASSEEGEESEGDESADAEEEPSGEAATATQSAPADPLGPPPTTVTYMAPLPEARDGDFTLPIPPVLIERRAGVATTAVFPLFYLREEEGLGARAPEGQDARGLSELVIPPIYHREGRTSGDVVFPLFWWFRGEGWHTWIVPPVWSHSDSQGYSHGALPFYLAGARGRSYHTIIPPLLTAAWGDENEEFLFSAVLFYKLRNRDQERWGLFPFLWWNSTPNENYQFVAPFYFRHRNERTAETLHIVPPGLFYLSEQENKSFWGIAGLLHHEQGADFHGTTIPPLLFHFSEAPNTFRLSTPFFFYMNEAGSETFVTWLYQRYRGATEFDAVAPFFFWTRDPRDHSESVVVPPVFARWTSPAYANTLVLPFFAHFDEYGRRQTWLTPFFGNTRDLENGDETTWVLPTIQVSRWHDGDAVNIHPIWYYESVPSHRHSVLFPLWFDFEQFERHDRYTVLFPLYWRFVEGVTETQLVLNTYYRHREWKNEGRAETEFHVAPLFDYGESTLGEHWWRVLYGLVGWEHRLDHDRLWLFYLPIDFAHAPRTPSTALAIPTYSLQ